MTPPKIRIQRQSSSGNSAEHPAPAPKRARSSVSTDSSPNNVTERGPRCFNRMDEISSMSFSGLVKNSQPQLVLKRAQTRTGVADADYYKKKFQELLEAKEHTDWTIVSSDGQAFPCHKAILSLNVPYFRKMLAKPDVPDQFDMKRFETMNSETMQALMRFIYYKDTSSMENNAKTTCALIRVALFIDFPDFLEAAVKQLQRIKDNIKLFENSLNELHRLRKQLAQPSEFISQDLKQKLSAVILDVVAKLFEIPFGNEHEDSQEKEK